MLAIGAEPDDDEDTRLRKVLLLVAALVITPLAVAWGALYWTVGATGAAAIPWLYVGISLASLISFGADAQLSVVRHRPVRSRT